MKLVQQLDYWGCGPACLAMVCSITYEEADLILDRKNNGTKWNELLKALKKLKFKFKKIKGYKGLDDCKTAILAVSWAKKTSTWHFVVLNDNLIYDPELEKAISIEEMLLSLPIIRSYVKLR